MFSCLLRLIPAKCQEVSVLVEGCSCFYMCLVMNDLFVPWARELVAMTPSTFSSCDPCLLNLSYSLDCENKCQKYGPGYHWQISDVGRYTMLKCYIYKTNHRVGDDAAWQFYTLFTCLYHIPSSYPPHPPPPSPFTPSCSALMPTQPSVLRALWDFPHG